MSTLTKRGVSPVLDLTLYGDSPRLSRRSDHTSVTKRPLRADAQRNYDAIVQAALDVFAEQGTQGSLDDIATRASVANATLYRRFPTREDLLVAALRHRMAELDEIAGQLSASDNPGAALEEWFFHLATHLRTWRGLPDSIARALSDDGSPLSHACQPLEVWTERLLARSTRTNFTRVDLDPHDVFTLVASLAWAADTRGDSEHDLRRMVHLVLEGLCERSSSPESPSQSSVA
jgi:AcrR family transcriptional regulator